MFPWKNQVEPRQIKFSLLQWVPLEHSSSLLAGFNLFPEYFRTSSPKTAPDVISLNERLWDQQNQHINKGPPGHSSQEVRRGQSRAADKSPGRWGGQRPDQPIACVGGMCSLGAPFLPEGWETPNSLPEIPAAVQQQILLKISQDFLYQLVPWSVAFHVE